MRDDLTIRKGTAIATFIDGKYPNHGTGNQAAFFLSQDVAGFWVVDQGETSGTIQKRRLRFKGKDKDNRYIDPSNNADAFSAIE